MAGGSKDTHLCPRKSKGSIARVKLCPVGDWLFSSDHECCLGPAMKNPILMLFLTKTGGKVASKECSPCKCLLVLVSVQEYAKAIGFALGIGRTYHSKGPPVTEWHTLSLPKPLSHGRFCLQTQSGAGM